MRKLYKKIILLFVLIFIFLFEIQINSVYAATLKFYNFSKGAYENYTGKQVIYTHNTKEVPLDYPGILINGTALADYEDLFVSELGLYAERTGDVITITDGTNTLKLTIGSKKILVNGVSKSASVAPVKLKFDDNVKYYVPTRFVAEAFGYDYVWTSSTSTVTITETIQMVCESTETAYTDALYSVYFENQKVNTTKPIICYDGIVMAPAEQIFVALGCSYTEYGNIISIKKDELTLHTEFLSTIAFVNEKKIFATSMPMHVTDVLSGTTENYISLEFVSDMLGFEFDYSDKEKSYSFKENEYTGKIAFYPDLQAGLWDQGSPEPSDTIENVTAEEQRLEKLYYEWSTPENNFDSEKNYLSKIRAYHIENADVIEFYGITKDNINDFWDNGIVFFELKDVFTDIESQFFSEYNSKYINYTLFSSIKNNSKLLFLIPSEVEWTLVETADGVRAFFSQEYLSEEDLNIFSQEQTQTNTTIENKVTITYPDDKIIIPIPDTVDITQISDEDTYWENRFFIEITGNYEEYYAEHPIINPYYGIKISNIEYDIVNNLTRYTFETNTIYGYSYSCEDGYLALTLGKPGDIYSKVVIFDAGHGGKSAPGAERYDVLEKDLNFKIINTYVKDAFKGSDIKVYFTRVTDTNVDLYERASFASKIEADMFISLHMNSFTSDKKYGTEVYYSKANNVTSESGFNSYLLAKNLITDLCRELDSKNQGVYNSDFVVTKYNTVPAVLIELGYMSNDSDFKKLTDETYQKKAAQTIYQTVTRLFDTYY